MNGSIPKLDPSQNAEEALLVGLHREVARPCDVARLGEQQRELHSMLGEPSGPAR